ncbi:hypothetical protein DFH06DRAFT_1339789 [Mycena polygramma]|nr:hypothetical protein DFH06DRAFT_1339789 [Mycena polygramma]
MFLPSSFLLAYILDAAVFILALCLVWVSRTTDPQRGVLWPFFRVVLSEILLAASLLLVWLLTCAVLIPEFHTFQVVRGIFKGAAAAWWFWLKFRRVFGYVFGSASAPSHTSTETRHIIQAAPEKPASCTTPSAPMLSAPTLLLVFLGGIVIALLYLLIDERRRFGRFHTWRDAAALDTDSATTVERDPNDLSKTLEAIKAALKCPICTELLTQPYTLDPCGHTFDLACLQQWFRTGPPGTEAPPTGLAYCPLDHDKVCPICRANVYLPAPCYSLKSVLAAFKSGSGKAQLADETNPWVDIFFEDLDLIVKYLAGKDT